MDTKQKYSAGLLAILALGIAWLKWMGHPSVAVAPASNTAAGVNPFIAPYDWSTPGISDDANMLNGGPPFESTVNVSVNPSYLGTLSEQFIPLFGFVGMGVRVGANAATNQLSAPPPAAVGFVSSLSASSIDAISPNPFNQPRPLALLS